MPEDASGRPTADTAGWRPVTRSLTYQLVVEAVEAQILTGALKVGDHLPPERELATLLGASRPAVREGMRMLEAQGVLRTVGAGPGSATVITALPSEALTRLLRLHLALSSFRMSDVVEARVMLERSSAELAAQHAEPAELDRIRAVLDRMDDLTLSMEEFNELDTEFHVSLADAGDNQLVADMTRAIRGAVRDALLAAFRALDDWPATAARLRAEHRAVYEAVASGDPTGAADAVERHIRGFWSG
jgi:GntR family transcriptional regulator, transcriptional repressor for pyruvate dehydrogenase complex